MSRTHDSIYKEIYTNYPMPYSFDPNKDLDEQKEAIRKKYIELLKMPEKNFKAKATIEWEKNDDERFDEIRFTVETEPDFFVPCHMLIPKGLKKGEKLPTVMCLQGHSTGMHISLGRPIYPGDEKDIAGGDRDFALQIVREGYIAVAMEQRAFGELKTNRKGNMCHQYALRAMMCGRTIQGDRIHDVMCLCDALEGFEQVDMDRLALMGNSGGGTTTYHATALEPRIKVCMPSCSFNTYAGCILLKNHCPCNYVPGIMEHMEMPDLAMLIAPRPLLIVNGEQDWGFPIETAREAFEIVKKIYEKAGAPDNCRHIIGPEGHRFYANISWPVFKEFI